MVKLLVRRARSVMHRWGHVLVLASLLVLGASATGMVRTGPIHDVPDTTAPPARCCGSLAYDAATGLILFAGGTLTANLNDSWTWSGQAWAALSRPIAPGTRYNAGMVDDATAGALLLFGGPGTASQSLLDPR